MTNLEKNISQIKKINPDLADKIKGAVKSDDFYFSDGNMFIRKNDRIITAYNLDEYKKLVDSIDENVAKREDVTLLIGLGKKELLNQIIEKKEDDHIIIVFEPVYFLINSFLSDKDYSDLIERRSLIFASTDEKSAVETISLLSQLKAVRNWNILVETYINDCHDKYKDVMGAVIETVNQIQCSVGTVTGAGPAIAENDIKNLPYILDSKGVECLNGKYSGRSAICVSTGPSLTKNIHLLKKAQDEGILIIAVAQALRALLAYDVKPNFITTVDYGKTNYEHFKGLFHIKDVPLVVLNRTYFQILKEWRGPKYITVSDQVPIPGTLQEFLSKRGSLLQGGSVSHLSLGLAVHLGCSDITLIGSDLAYEKDRSHVSLADASGSVKFGKAGQINWNVDDPSSHLNGQDNSMGYAQYVDSYFYDSIVPAKIPTNLGLMSFITSFERISKMPGMKEAGINFFNSTEGGAKIKGYKNISLRKFIDKFGGKGFIPLLGIDDSIEESPLSEINKVLPLLKEEMDDFKEIISLCKKGIKSADKMRTKNSTPGSKEWMAQDEINKKTSMGAHKLCQKNDIMKMRIYKASREISFGKYAKARPKGENNYINNDQAIDRNIFILTEAKKAARELGRIYREVDELLRKAVTKKKLFYMDSLEEPPVDTEIFKKYIDLGNFAWPLLASKRSLEMGKGVDICNDVIKKCEEMKKEKIDEAEREYKEREDLIQYANLILESKDGVDISKSSDEMMNKALEKIQKAIGIFPNKIQARWGMANVYHHLKRYDDSEKVYSELIEEFPGLHRLEFEKCLLYMSMKKDDCFVYFKDFIDKYKEQYGHFYFKLSGLFVEKDDYNLAEECMDSYLELFPMSDQAKKIKKALDNEKSRG